MFSHALFFQSIDTSFSAQIRRLLILLTTHSDPDRGDLHACKGYAAPPDEVCCILSSMYCCLTYKQAIYVSLPAQIPCLCEGARFPFRFTRVRRYACL